MTIQIHRVNTLEDCAVCQSIAGSVWGTSAACSVPQMIVHAKYGGVVLLATDGQRSVGFLFSFPARYRGETVLWSHETAVLPEYLHQGIGFHLKSVQRQIAADEGYHNIVWTFDPLVARNAHFNLNKLRARVDAYQRNVYGKDEADLVNQGLETDRFLAVWPVREVEWAMEKQSIHQGGDADTALAIREDGGPQPLESVGFDGVVRTAIPLHFGEMTGNQRDMAFAWRHAFRAVAEHLWSTGYRPIHFETNVDSGWYLWNRDEVQ